MTLLKFRETWLFEDTLGTASAATAVLDGAADQLAGLLLIPGGMTIDRLFAYITANTGTPPTYELRLESLSLSTGLPSGSLIAANTNLTFTPTTTGLKENAMTASYSAAVDELVAVVLKYNTGTISGSHFSTFRSRFNLSAITPFVPRALEDLSAGTWSLGQMFPMVGARFSDGSYPPRVYLTSSGSTRTYNSGSTPDERGLRFTSLAAQYCSGAAVFVRASAIGSDYTVKLYDAAGTLLASGTIDASLRHWSTAATAWQKVYWSSPVLLTAGADYRLTVLPTTANNVTATDFTFENADARAAVCGERWSTSRTDAGAWTDDDTSCYLMTPIISEYAAGGAAGIIRVGQTGGFPA